MKPIRATIPIRLGTVQIQHDAYMRAKALGYTRDDIRKMILEEGEGAFQHMIDTRTFCDHQRPMSEPCVHCQIEAEGR